MKSEDFSPIDFSYFFITRKILYLVTETFSNYLFIILISRHVDVFKLI